jgi:hypothetical protein
LVRSSGRPIAEVARSLGISDATSWNWAKGAREADAAGVTIIPIAWRSLIAVPVNVLWHDPDGDM